MRFDRTDATDPAPIIRALLALVEREEVAS